MNKETINYDDMLSALDDAIYKLESIYNSTDDREEIMWHLDQLNKLENLLIELKLNAERT